MLFLTKITPGKSVGADMKYAVRLRGEPIITPSTQDLKWDFLYSLARQTRSRCELYVWHNQRWVSVLGGRTWYGMYYEPWHPLHNRPWMGWHPHSGTRGKRHVWHLCEGGVNKTSSARESKDSFPDILIQNINTRACDVARYGFVFYSSGHTSSCVLWLDIYTKED